MPRLRRLYQEFAMLQVPAAILHTVSVQALATSRRRRVQLRPRSFWNMLGTFKSSAFFSETTSLLIYGLRFLLKLAIPSLRWPSVPTFREEPRNTRVIDDRQTMMIRTRTCRCGSWCGEEEEDEDQDHDFTHTDDDSDDAGASAGGSGMVFCWVVFGAGWRSWRSLC